MIYRLKRWQEHAIAVVVIAVVTLELVVLASCDSPTPVPQPGPPPRFERLAGDGMWTLAAFCDAATGNLIYVASRGWDSADMVVVLDGCVGTRAH